MTRIAAICLLLLSATPLRAEGLLVKAYHEVVHPDSAAQAAASPSPVEQTAAEQLAAVQPGSETFTAPPIVVGAPEQSGYTRYQPGSPAPFGGDPFNPAQQPMPMTSVPFADPGAASPIFPYSSTTPDTTMMPTTVNGPLPDRFGLTQRYEFGLLPSADAFESQGKLAITEFDLAWKFRMPLSTPASAFSFTQQYDSRFYEGPQTAIGTVSSLPGSVHRIGWDFELKSSLGGPLGYTVGFNPSINSDFDGSLSSEAWNWDGRGALLYTLSPEFTFLLGVAYLDRVDDLIIPWVGVIYRPNEYVQWDLVLPQLRVSFYMWDEFGFRTSLYARVEYHSEAYEIKNVNDDREKVQLTDWRAMIGVNKDRGEFDYFFEGGWVFHRDVEYSGPSADFGVTSGMILRAGMRF